MRRPTGPNSDILGVLLNLHRELGDRILLTGSIEEIVEAEWADTPHYVSRSFSHLEGDLLACIRGNGAGTMLDEAARGFAEWRAKRRTEREEETKSFGAKYLADPRFRESIGLVLEKAVPPGIYGRPTTLRPR